MSSKKYTKEAIINLLKEQAKRLGKDNLTKQEISQCISTSTVNSYFGTVRAAMEFAGLTYAERGENLKNRPPQINDDDLFNSILVLEAELGEIPNYNQYQAMGNYSVKPFRQRFGKWEDVIAYYQKWKTENSLSNPVHQTQTSFKKVKTTTPKVQPPKAKKPPKLYGEPIDFRGLHHAPTNEQGVVFLFGMVCRELGFRIEIVRTGFPDFEGKYLYNANENLWAEARIEIEFKASNFKDHGHNPDECDFIVCWENDWPDCPLTIIELKSEIMKLPSR
ncbi:MAG TPA: hypothetical protein V6C99_02230 [Oculatellaceae cyanobacterium]